MGAVMANTGGVTVCSEKKSLTLKNRLSSMNNTYSQTLTDRQVLIRQREKANRTFHKYIKQERNRIIRSATRRNPKNLSAAIKKTKKAMEEYEEWRTNQSNTNNKFEGTQNSVTKLVLSIDNQPKLGSGLSTKDLPNSQKSQADFQRAS